MLIPFCSKIRVAGQGLHKVLAEKIQPEALCRCGDFPDKPLGSDLGKADKPRTTFAYKKEQHPS